MSIFRFSPKSQIKWTLTIFSEPTPWDDEGALRLCSGLMLLKKSLGFKRKSDDN
jgi:hypothetical protein